jgi:hypothetical protein
VVSSYVVMLHGVVVVSSYVVVVVSSYVVMASRCCSGFELCCCGVMWFRVMCYVVSLN